MLISKTFDASVICPAEQTCVVDDAIYDEIVAELERMGARVLIRRREERLAHSRSPPTAAWSCARSASRASTSPPWPGSSRPPTPRSCWPRSRPTSRSSRPSVRTREADAGARTRPLADRRPCARRLRAGDRARRARSHVARSTRRDERVVSGFSERSARGGSWSTRPTAVGALGGVYNSMTPTFSLGCGTWGGSITTDNVNYRNLLNVKTVSGASPSHGSASRRTPTSTRGQSTTCASSGRTSALIVTDPRAEARGDVEDVRAHLDGNGVHIYSDIGPSRPRPSAAAARGCSTPPSRSLIAIGGGCVIDPAKVCGSATRLRSCTWTDLALPFLDVRKRIADYPQRRPTRCALSRCRPRAAPALRCRRRQ